MRKGVERASFNQYETKYGDKVSASRLHSSWLYICSWMFLKMPWPSSELKTTLTGKTRAGRKRPPMCGVPHHAGWLNIHARLVHRETGRRCNPKTTKESLKRGKYQPRINLDTANKQRNPHIMWPYIADRYGVSLLIFLDGRFIVTRFRTKCEIIRWNYRFTSVGDYMKVCERRRHMMKWKTLWNDYSFNHVGFDWYGKTCNIWSFNTLDHRFVIVNYRKARAGALYERFCRYSI